MNEQDPVFLYLQIKFQLNGFQFYEAATELINLVLDMQRTCFIDKKIIFLNEIRIFIV